MRSWAPWAIDRKERRKRAARVNPYAQYFPTLPDMVASGYADKRTMSGKVTLPGNPDPTPAEWCRYLWPEDNTALTDDYRPIKCTLSERWFDGSNGLDMAAPIP